MFPFCIYVGVGSLIHLAIVLDLVLLLFSADSQMISLDEEAAMHPAPGGVVKGMRERA